jgi:Uma2 family endonuclease
VAVVRGDIRDYTTAHPTDPVLVVEVTFSSVALDRRYKSSLYARARRPEYWVLNLIDHVLEVRREPAPSLSSPYGWDYSTVQLLSAGQHVSPLAAPATAIAVADLLP